MNGTPELRPIGDVLADVAMDIKNKLPPEEEQKRECLAKWVLDHFAKQNAGKRRAAELARSDRADWLASFERRHGEALTSDIKARMMRIHRERKAAQ